jgi:molecular chaperone DnaJ
MPARPSLPTDDLYRRLGVPRDASFEAIELAWRGLLRLHHPDIAGPDALELAKRINVAHDWLSDPELRQRYDREHHTGIRSGRPPRAGPTGPPWPPGPERDQVRWAPRRPPTTAERVATVVERVGRLSADELDRMALAEPAPIAFLATLRQFVPGQLETILDEAERTAIAALPPAARRVVAIRDSVIGQLADIVLGDLIDDILGEPAGTRARERLTRGWDAAVGQPRYGPATTGVATLLDALRSLDGVGVRGLAATGGREALGDEPWPAATSPDEDEALRVSSALAATDARQAVDAAPGSPERGSPAARRAAARIAHLLVLRHAFAASAFERHAAAWLGTLIPRVPNWRTHARRRSGRH